MSLSVNNNAAAQLALQSLNQTTQQLQTSENQVASGLAVS
jgi:flagellin-like hook-associated protein FlgL